jgi:DUF1365 family protein
MLRQAVGIMLSCIYEGSVQHRRARPAKHKFRYGLYMLYLDLDELPSLLRGSLGLHEARFAPASFCRQDHLGDPAVPLRESLFRLVREQTGWQPAGPVRLLTLLRNFGYYFSPLNLYFCFAGDGRNVTAVVAEVTNTPWLEKHWYVLWEGNRIGRPEQLHFRHPKSFHVSPFMDMDAVYEWRLSPPEPQLAVSLSNLREGERFFDVSMVLQRRELSRSAMRHALARRPWMTARVSQAIYWQALRLWLKNCPFYPHPKYRKRLETQQP